MFARKFLTLFFEGLVMHLPFVTKDEDAPVSDVATAGICFFQSPTPAQSSRFDLSSQMHLRFPAVTLSPGNTFCTIACLDLDDK